MRRGLGRGRGLVAIGAILAVISLPLSWQKAGGVVLEVETAWGFAGSGSIMVLAAVLMLGLLVVPYTTRTGDFTLDRPVVYALLAVIGIVGLVLAILDLVGGQAEYSLTPLDAPGLWLAVVGMAIATWGVLEMFAEKPRAP